MRNGLMASALAVLVSLGCDVATAASIRDIYFSKGELVAGQRLQRDSQLPGPATAFARDDDKVARLFIVIGDRASPVVRGDLKNEEGRVVARMKRDIESLSTVGQWRVITHAFKLEKLKPGKYSIEVLVDDENKGTYGFTLT